MKEQLPKSPEKLNEEALQAQKEIEAGGEGAREAHFKLNKIAKEATESDEIRLEADKENKLFDERKEKEKNEEQLLGKYEKLVNKYKNTKDRQEKSLDIFLKLIGVELLKDRKISGDNPEAFSKIDDMLQKDPDDISVKLARELIKENRKISHELAELYNSMVKISLEAQDSKSYGPELDEKLIDIDRKLENPARNQWKQE